MKVDLKIVVAISLVIIIILLHTCFDTLNQGDGGIYGFFEADSKFKEKSGLDAMYLYISPPKADANRSIGVIGEKCSVYVLIKADDKVMANEVVKTAIRRTNIRPNELYSYTFDFGKKIGILPQCISVKYDPISCMMVLRSGKTMFARLFKKPEASFYCQIQPKLQEPDDSSANDSSDDDDDEEED